MREIKFRIWNKTKKTMLYPEDFRFNRDWSYFVNWSVREDGLVVGNQYDSEIMQFTGLKDKNGKDIYEGDIVYHSYYGENGKMVFNQSRSAYEIEWGDKKTNEMYLVDRKSFLVIGNIYETPELARSVK